MDDVDLLSPHLFINRELSWLDFNRRVLDLARRSDVPVLERLKFIAIASSNLDEFFMVRVGGLERHARADDDAFEMGPDGLELDVLLREVWTRATTLIADLSNILDDEVLPALEASGIHILGPKQFDESIEADALAFYEREVHPCLTPIAIDTAHPFPNLRNGSLNLALRVKNRMPAKKHARFEQPSGELLAIVQVPSVLPRFAPFPAAKKRFRFLALEGVIKCFVGQLFPGYDILEASPFRVMRASDLDIAEDEAENLLSTIQDELRRRDRGEPVRLDISDDASEELTTQLAELIGVKPRQVVRIRGLVAKAELMKVYGGVKAPHLRDDPFTPAQMQRLSYAPTIFRSIAERDILLQHPYHSFRHVVDFIDQAASDPDVVAIKQTLYRTSGDSPIVRALMRAAEKGKQVTALVELKARFDEANNIAWAMELEESGVHVVYGLIGLKTHCKLLLVTRREGDKLKRYLHLSTGNYNPSTARLYTDLGLFTAQEEITRDAMLLFNVLTGYAELPKMAHLVVAPFTLRRRTLAMIEREIEHKRAGRPAGIVAKMNSLVDGEVIAKLYEASRAGVSVDLIIRGICCLRPGVPGVSENIRVRSILGRFLEHSRIFWWKNGGDDEVYLSSADWMPRNLNRRIEVGFPVLDENIRRKITEDLLPIELADNTFAWTLDTNGDYQHVHPADGEEPLSAQAAFIAMTKKRASSGRTAVRPEVPAKPGFSPAVRVAAALQRRHDQR